VTDSFIQHMIWLCNKLPITTDVVCRRDQRKTQISYICLCPTFFTQQKLNSMTSYYIWDLSL